MKVITIDLMTVIGGLAKCCFMFQVEPEEHVIDQGDDGDNFYVIDR